MTPFPTFVKDPSATLDYGVDWATRGWLATGETIVASDWTAPAGLTEGSSAINGGITVVWLSGGTTGQTYQVVNQITTSAGRIDQRTIEIRVRER